MEAFGIIDTIRTYCIKNNIFFIPGDEAYVNAVADYSVYENNDLILYCNFNSSPVISGSRIVSNSYSGVMALGRKCEEQTELSVLVDEIDNVLLDEDENIIYTSEQNIETVSSLDETFEQKYDRRLRTLSQELADLIGYIACDNELEISNLNFKMELNKFDLSCDFVACSLILTE